ncbi:hypothetical protein, partial [Streptomyces scabiei]|uniref:hypothetical protein n=1 Tax=Streptomyces scabiei TaxID=1930 RepID=UPI0038F808E8
MRNNMAAFLQRLCASEGRVPQHGDFLSLPIPSPWLCDPASVSKPVGRPEAVQAHSMLMLRSVITLVQ